MMVRFHQGVPNICLGGAMERHTTLKMSHIRNTVGSNPTLDTKIKLLFGVTAAQIPLKDSVKVQILEEQPNLWNRSRMV